jgi:hypothetical protein
MSKNIAFPLLILLLFLFNYDICQSSELDTIKAIGCISVIRKMENKSTDQRLISGYLLSCFINIDESTARQLIPTDPLSSNLNIDKEQIERLTDFNSLQTKYSQSDIMEYSKRLNSAIEKLQDGTFGDGKGSNRRGKKEKGESQQSEGSGFIPFLINSIVALFNPNDSFLLLIGFFVFIYFSLKGLRKLFGNKKKNTDKKKGKKIN